MIIVVDSKIRFLFLKLLLASWKCSFKIHSEKQKIKPFLKKIRTGKNGPISPHTGHISA
jgi:hypothetical protein